MKIVSNKSFDAERAFYGERGLKLVDCKIDGPADGESAFKEGGNIVAEKCFFNLRYPFWHCDGVDVKNSDMTPFCRAAAWYSKDICFENCKMHGIKAVRECQNVCFGNCDIDSAEFGWLCRDIKMVDSKAKGEYFMFRSHNLDFKGTSLQGKYSFQYITDSTFENCDFDTKDAFWHAKNVVVKNSRIKGEYLGWYSEDLTFENCVIEGTQPLCYCKGLKLINCEMHNADLSFEKSEVIAEVTTPIISIKNPICGKISAPEIGEIIMDIESDCKIIAGENK